MTGIKATVSVSQYHQRTKHGFNGYAKGPDTIDWDAQPDAFRRFDGTHITLLPFAADKLAPPYKALLNSSVISLKSTLESLSQLLEISVAVSAWKQYGSSRWSLRCNPSSGNLHPTETYVIALGITELCNGVYHYRADIHALELRCRFAAQPNAESPLLLLGLASVHWREAWKYGERAFRYCQHDVGHAVAAISYGAATLGWSIQPLYDLGDKKLAGLLGIDRRQDFAGAEAEHPDLLIALQPSKEKIDNLGSVLAMAAEGEWRGTANVLDAKHHYSWPVIDEVAATSQRPDLPPDSNGADETWPAPMPSPCEEPAAKLFRRRRSAQAFDGITGIAQDDFWQLLDHLLPRPDLPPWNLLPWQPRLHLVLFIHRVEGLKPGLYCLARSRRAVPQLKAAMRSEFSWASVDSAPGHLPFFLLVAAKAERTAADICCQQAIAATSAFSLGMLAEFEEQVQDRPWRYRELFWEAGVIGQALYTEAEAVGLQGTGIGCYFDDPFHQLLGLQDNQFQSLYHFTVGGAVTDNRIISLPPYDYSRRTDYG